MRRSRASRGALATHDAVVEVRIERLATGESALWLVAVLVDGSIVLDRLTGTEERVREVARSLAGHHDLVPFWDDRSWLQGNRRRPPATRYAVR